MFDNYFKVVKNQSEDVFGVKAKKTLSIYSVFSAACVILPLIIVLSLLANKIF